MRETVLGEKKQPVQPLSILSGDQLHFVRRIFVEIADELSPIFDDLPANFGFRAPEIDLVAPTGRELIEGRDVRFEVGV